MFARDSDAFEMTAPLGGWRIFHATSPMMGSATIFERVKRCGERVASRGRPCKAYGGEVVNSIRAYI